MRNERNSSKSGLFLIELIISIVFFAVASAICTQLFVQAHLISTRSNDVNVASAIAQNCAEEFRGADHQAKADVSASTLDSAETFRYYDRQGHPLTGSGQAAYLLNLSYDNSAAPLYSVQIDVYKVRSGAAAESGEPLFSLEVKDYAGLNV